MSGEQQLSSDPAGLDDPIKACPECGLSNIWKRKTKEPPYRCEKGHKFDQPAFKEVRHRYDENEADDDSGGDWPIRNPTIQQAREHYADEFDIPVEMIAATRRPNGNIVCVAMDEEKINLEECEDAR